MKIDISILTSEEFEYISSTILFHDDVLRRKLKWLSHEEDLIEENYYDFLSLKGTVKRPTLGYRTLSDSEWIYTEQFISDEDEEDFEEIFDYCFDKLGEWRTKNVHIHFSKIEFLPKHHFYNATRSLCYYLLETLQSPCHHISKWQFRFWQSNRQ